MADIHTLSAAKEETFQPTLGLSHRLNLGAQSASGAVRNLALAPFTTGSLLMGPDCGGISQLVPVALGNYAHATGGTSPMGNVERGSTRNAPRKSPHYRQWHLGILMTFAACQASWRLRTISWYDCCFPQCLSAFQADGMAVWSSANRPEGTVGQNGTGIKNFCPTGRNSDRKSREFSPIWDGMGQNGT